MRVHILPEPALIAPTTFTDIVPFSAPLDIKTSSGGIHTTSLNIYRTLTEQRSEYIKKMVGVTVLCIGKMASAAFLWEHDGSHIEILSVPRRVFGKVVGAQMQTLLDMAIDLTPIEELNAELEFYGREVNELAASSRECTTRVEKLQMERYKKGSMAKLLNEPTDELDALEEREKKLHNEHMLVTSRWYLLERAVLRRQIPSPERIAENERIRQRVSSYPRA